VELDDTVADGHFALADIMTWTDWDWAGAEREWRRAIELDPGSSVALATYSHYLKIVRRPDEAMAKIRRALELDPFNVMTQSFYAIDLLFVRRYDDAIAQARATLRQQPGAPVAMAALWIAFRAKGMEKEALAAARDCYALYGTPELGAALDRGFAKGGYSVAMQEAAVVLAAYSRNVNVNPVDVVDLYIESGEEDRAIEWLEKGFAARDPNMPYLNLPQYDRLRGDPRFQDLLRRMRLPRD